MSSPIVKVFAWCALALGAIMLIGETDVRLPGDDTGYAPVQPIAYSHALHAGQLGIDCLYCHYAAQRSAFAGVPPASICMNCHATVTAGWDAVQREKELAAAEGREPRRIVSPELAKLYDALALDDQMQPVPGKQARPIAWIRVHDLPDFVVFDHRAHVTRGVECQACHGPVQTMDRVRQVADLSMGWCVECHRINAVSAGPGALLPGMGHPRVGGHVSTDCGTCHY